MEKQKEFLHNKICKFCGDASFISKRKCFDFSKVNREYLFDYKHHRMIDTFNAAYRTNYNHKIQIPPKASIDYQNSVCVKSNSSLLYKKGLLTRYVEFKCKCGKTRFEFHLSNDHFSNKEKTLRLFIK